MTLTDPTSPTLEREHLLAANPAVLTCVAASHSGDLPRARAFFADMTYGFERGGVVASLPRERFDELLDWAAAVIPVTSEPLPFTFTDVEFAELCTGLVGFEVTPETSAFYAEQGGLVDFIAPATQPDLDLSGIDLLVIGAGMAGIAAAVAADKAGIAVQVLEKADTLGGVWAANTYPGVGVDTPSAYYSFSFEVNREWSGVYPTGAEYLAYLNRVVDTYGLRDRIACSTEVTAMVWDEGSQRWSVTTRSEDGERVLSARAVMTAAGYLTRPQLPAVPGLKDFSGEWFHSAEWNHEVDLSGKHLAVVGTGCTSVQIVDSMIDRVASLTLVQRQPHWVMAPTVDEFFTPSESWLNRNVPEYARWARLLTFIPISDVNYPVVRWDADWAATHDLSISPANDVVLQAALSHLHGSFPDRPDLIERLTPTFAPFGKRTIRDPGGYYAALKDPKSNVVPGLSEVVADGFIDGEGIHHPVDAIVYATGFALEYLATIDIVGRNGLRLRDVWGDSPSAYNGIQVPGFPNLFVTSGPHANPSHGGGHNFSVEATVHYVIECLRDLAARGNTSMEPTPEALARWKAEVAELMADSVWARETRATTYYRNQAGEVILASPLTMLDYWTKLRSPNPTDLTYGG